MRTRKVKEGVERGSMERYGGNIKSAESSRRDDEKECKMERREECTGKRNSGGMKIEEEVAEEEKQRREEKGKDKNKKKQVWRARTAGKKRVQGGKGSKTKKKGKRQ